MEYDWVNDTNVRMELIELAKCVHTKPDAIEQLAILTILNANHHIGMPHLMIPTVVKHIKQWMIDPLKYKPYPAWFVGPKLNCKYNTSQ